MQIKSFGRIATAAASFAVLMAALALPATSHAGRRDASPPPPVSLVELVQSWLGKK